MKGLFILALASVLVLASAQDASNDGGCCFYAKPNHQMDENTTICTSTSVVFTEAMTFQSMFCNEKYSASVYDNNEGSGTPLDAFECGAFVPNITRGIINAKSCTVTRCPQPVCCMWGAVDFTGTQFCIVDLVLQVPDEDFKIISGSDSFASFSCSPGYKLVLSHPAGTFTVPCGGNAITPAAKFYTTAEAVKCDDSQTGEDKAEYEQEEILQTLDAADQEAIQKFKEQYSSENKQQFSADAYAVAEESTFLAPPLEPVVVEQTDIVGVSQSSANSFAAVLLVIVASCLVNLMA